MSFLLSLLIALGVGVATLFFSGFLASKATRWLRISQREGHAGYWVAFKALLFGLFGAIAGFVAARKAEGDDRWLALGLGLAVALALPSLWAFLAWLSRDKEPRLHGKRVGLDFELRAPAGVRLADNAAQIYSYLSATRARMESSKLDFTNLQVIEGRLVLPGFVLLHTSRPDPYLVFGGERLGGGSLYFSLDLPSPLKRAGRTWGEWRRGRSGGSKLPAEVERFELRYRLRSL